MDQQPLLLATLSLRDRERGEVILYLKPGDLPGLAIDKRADIC